MASAESRHPVLLLLMLVMMLLMLMGHAAASSDHLGYIQLRTSAGIYDVCF